MERDSCSRIRCLSQSTRKRGCELRFGESPSLFSLCLWGRRCCSSLNTSAARRWCKFGNSFGPARSTRLRLALSADIRTETERERERFMQEGNRRTNHQFLSWFCGVWLFWFLGVCRQRLGGRGPATEDSGTPAVLIPNLDYPMPDERTVPAVETPKVKAVNRQALPSFYCCN